MVVYNAPHLKKWSRFLFAEPAVFSATEGELAMKLRFLVVCVILMSAIAVAQPFRGTILGTVTDPSGNLVAGATVKVKNAGTGIERATTTSADGSYALPELPVGTYSVTVTQSGFQTSVTSSVEVNVATERRVDGEVANRPGKPDG